MPLLYNFYIETPEELFSLKIGRMEQNFIF